MTKWNSRDTLPLDGTRIRILWSNGEEDVGYFDRSNYGDPAEVGEWSTDYGNGGSSEFHPVGWLPLTPNTRS